MTLGEFCETMFDQEQKCGKVMARQEPTHMWCGEPEILPDRAPVVVLATDPDCPDGRGAAWIRYWPAERDYPLYRSCDVCDLELIDHILNGGE